MESALTTDPPSRAANRAATADLPLAVGPAINMAVGRVIQPIWRRSRRMESVSKTASRRIEFVRLEFAKGRAEFASDADLAVVANHLAPLRRRETLQHIG